MDKYFEHLPYDLVLWGNFLISVTGLVFIIGAPVTDNFKKLKNFFIYFWASLISYYLLRGTTGSIQHDRIFNTYVNFQSFNLNSPEMIWSYLVVLADISILMICLGHVFHKDLSKRTRILSVIIISCIFIFIWIIDFKLNHNVYSNILAFIVFFYTAWSARIDDITVSIIWLSYAILHLPLGLAVGITPEWQRTLFIVMLISKLSLIIAMYSMLGIKKKDSL